MQLPDDRVERFTCDENDNHVPEPDHHDGRRGPPAPAGPHRSPAPRTATPPRVRVRDWRPRALAEPVALREWAVRRRGQRPLPVPGPEGTSPTAAGPAPGAQ